MIIEVVPYHPPGPDGSPGQPRVDLSHDVKTDFFGAETVGNAICDCMLVVKEAGLNCFDFNYEVRFRL